MTVLFDLIHWSIVNRMHKPNQDRSDKTGGGVRHDRPSRLMEG